MIFENSAGCAPERTLLAQRIRGCNPKRDTGTSTFDDDYTTSSSYSSQGTYTVSLDEAGMPSTSSNTNFSDTETSGNTLDENSSVSTSSTGMEAGITSTYDPAEADVDNNVQGSNSYQQAGSYSTITDEGLTVNNPNIDTTQNDSSTSYNTAQSSDLHSTPQSGYTYTPDNDYTGVDVVSETSQAQDQETAAGRSGQPRHRSTRWVFTWPRRGDSMNRDECGSVQTKPRWTRGISIAPEFRRFTSASIG